MQLAVDHHHKVDRARTQKKRSITRFRMKYEGYEFEALRAWPIAARRRLRGGVCGRTNPTPKKNEIPSTDIVKRCCAGRRFCGDDAVLWRATFVWLSNSLTKFIIRMTLISESFFSLPVVCRCHPISRPKRHVKSCVFLSNERYSVRCPYQRENHSEIL